ncbi:MAG: VWA domain-containing protein [Planctomycetes bacterium]|nr:VWA domain-containing protein [Planctomycetota bacterium]
MTFLSPIPALIGAAVALPALVLLYFLKLRRREVRVSTTMLWLQSVEDLEANAPFQRLKPSLLFWLQVLVVAAVLLALARPTREIEGSGADSEHVILMIDVSASMQALLDPDGQTTRFDDARRRARELLDRLIRRSTRPQVMLMSVGHRPTTVVPWTGDLPVIRAALDDLQVRDEPARFGPAMQLADVLAMSSGAPQGATVPPPNPPYWPSCTATAGLLTRSLRRPAQARWYSIMSASGNRDLKGRESRPTGSPYPMSGSSPAQPPPSKGTVIWLMCWS